MPQDPPEVENISLCCYTSFESEMILGEYLDKIRRIHRPEAVSNQIVDIRPEEPLQSEIWFGESGSEHPEDADDNLIINIFDHDEEEEEDAEEELHIHGDFTGVYIEEFSELFSEISNVVGEFEVRITTILLEWPIAFQELSLPVDLESEFDVDGVRFEEEDCSFLFQSSPDNEQTFVRYNNHNTFFVDGEESDGFIESTVEQAKDDIQRFES